jgi:hypothetical protein
MMKIGIGVDQTTPPSQSSNGWQLAYAWATTLAPSIQTTQRQDASVTSLVPNAQASGNAPVANTSSALNVNVPPPVVNAQASAGTPVVDTTKSPNVLVPVATSQATAGAPSVSTGTTVNTSVSSVVAGTNASAGTPTVSATSGGGTTYLQMDGVDDVLRSSVVTVNRIVMTFSFESNPTNSSYLFDNRTGTPTGNYMVYITSSNVLSKGTGISTLSNNGSVLSPSTKYTIDATLDSSVVSNSNGIEFFVNYLNQNTTRTKGNIYRITGYNGASVVFDYDMSTGTVQDQSGNGNHATLTGGTWMVA